MARPFRKERVASLIHEIVGETILSHMHDPRIAPLTTVTRVEVAPDLLVARVYFSVPGGDAVEHRTMAAIRHAGGFIQRIVAKELTLRQCPELRFEIDETAKRVRTIMTLLDENRRNNPELFATPDDADGADEDFSGAVDDEFEEADDEEEVQETPSDPAEDEEP